jgi:hypothetical protein
MTPLAQKVKALFGKPELAAEEPAATIRPTPEPRPEEDESAPITGQDEGKKVSKQLLTLRTRPHINERGELIIPFSADPKYHYWKPCGQSIGKTLAELNAPPEVWRRYVGSYSETKQ